MISPRKEVSEHKLQWIFYLLKLTSPWEQINYLVGFWSLFSCIFLSVVWTISYSRLLLKGRAVRLWVPCRSAHLISRLLTFLTPRSLGSISNGKLLFEVKEQLIKPPICSDHDQPTKWSQTATCFKKKLLNESLTKKEKGRMKRKFGECDACPEILSCHKCFKNSCQATFG